MKHTARIKAIEQKIGTEDEGISVIIRYIRRDAGEVLREDITRTPGYRGRPSIIIADEIAMRL